MRCLTEADFKIGIGVLLVIAGLGRRILGGNWRERRKKTVRRETGPLFLSIVFFPAYGSLFLYFCTSWLDPFHVPLPVWLRLVGGLILLIGDSLLVWTHWALGKNWSPYLEIREEHTLVTTGPYRCVRHPMYSAWVLICIGLSVLSANWLIAVTWLGGYGLILGLRIPAEEQMMIEEFGDAYREYMKKTGRVLPRLRG